MRRLNVVDRNLLAAGGAVGLVLGVAVLVELEAAVAVLVAAEGVGLVDLGCVGELAVGFPGGGLVMLGRGRGVMRGGAYKERASSALYLRITSPFSSWYSRSDTRMMSPLLIQIFFRSLPRIRPRRLTPSKHCRLVSPGPLFSSFLPSALLVGGETYHGLESAVTQHLENLGVLLPFLLEGELALLIAISSVSGRGAKAARSGVQRRTRSRSFLCGGSCHLFPCSSAY
jgi:hypothetical protein